MGWKELIDKTAYWLKLRKQRKQGGGGDDGGEPVPAESGAGLPERVEWREAARFERESYKVSAAMPLEGGRTLVCCYNNAERGTSRLHVVGADGGRTEIWKGGEETIGQGCEVDGTWFLPVEKKGGHVIAVPTDGSKASAYVAQGGQYSAKIVDGHIAVGNQLFALSNTSAPVAAFPRLAGIVSGLVHVGDEWIASDDERGIQSSKGWFIECLCPELAALDGVAYAFLRSGEVRRIEIGTLGKTMGNTLHKARRAWSDGQRIWWTTAPTDGGDRHQVWCMSAEGMRNFGEFQGKRENTPTTSLGSLFGSAICVRNGGTIIDVAVTDETQNGWVLYRGTAVYPPKPEPTPAPEADPEPDPEPEPEPEPQPEPEPMPEPEPDPQPAPTPEPTPTPAPQPTSEDFTPPARTGENAWKGNGKWNTYKDAGRAKESSSKRVLVEGWFKVAEWSGGGEAQPKGFVFACKGRLGNHWGFNLAIRPDGVVWNATKGEILAKAKVTAKEWHHVRAVADKSSVKMWLDGRLLANGPKEFSGNLIADSDQPLRIGGYHCEWNQATWFNQSLNGEMEWKVEMA